MNCTEHTRFLGRSLTLTTNAAQVQQVTHQECMPGAAKFSATSQPAQRDDIRLHFEDGSETSVAVLGSGFRATPGQNITAVNAGLKGGRSAGPLYCFNNETRKGWFNTAALKRLRRGAPHRMVIWLLPLLLVLGAWMSPAPTRADLAAWVSDQSGIVLREQARSEGAATASAAQFDEMLRFAAAVAVPNDAAPSRLAAAHGFSRSLAGFAVEGWRDRNWAAFGVVAALTMIGFTALGHLLIVVPSTWKLRRRIKRLVRRHQRAMQT